MGYSPWGRKESDTTERFHFLSFFCPFTLSISSGGNDVIQQFSDRVGL